MGFRFHRSIKIFPGIRVNLGKRGVSTSIGVRGAHITLGHGTVRETLSLPGSGLSFTHTSRTHTTRTHRAGTASVKPVHVIYPVAPVEREGLAKCLAIIMVAVIIATAILQHL